MTETMMIGFGGALSFLFLFTLIQYIQNREKYFLHYCLYIGSFSLAIFSKYISVYLGYNFNFFFNKLVIISYWLFIESLLKISQKEPVFKVFAKYYISFLVVYIFAQSAFAVFRPGGSVFLFLQALFPFFVIPPSFVIFYFVLKLREKLAYYIFLGSISLFVGFIIRLLFFESFGNFPIYIASGVELLIFSAAVGYKMKLKEREARKVEIDLLKKELDKQKVERELQNLQQRLGKVETRILRSQMNQHFIFNSLNSIKLLIQENKNEEAIDYLLKFSNLIRAIIENYDNTKIPLSDELSFCDLYLKLEALRFDNTFDYEIKIKD